MNTTPKKSVGPAYRSSFAIRAEFEKPMRRLVKVLGLETMSELMTLLAVDADATATALKPIKESAAFKAEQAGIQARRTDRYKGSREQTAAKLKLLREQKAQSDLPASSEG